MKKITIIICMFLIFSCKDSKKIDEKEKNLDSLVVGEKYSFFLEGIFKGTQKGYYPKNKLGDYVIIQGNKLYVPSVNYEFSFQDDFNVSLQQSVDGSRYYYEGTYKIIENERNIVIIDCQLLETESQNSFTMIIEYSKTNDIYTLKSKDGSPDFEIKSNKNKEIKEFEEVVKFDQKGKKDFYYIMLMDLKNEINERKCSACSGEFNLKNIEVFESHENYLINIKEDNSYSGLIDIKNYYNKYTGFKLDGNSLKNDEYTLINSFSGGKLIRDLIINLITENVPENINSENISSKEEEKSEIDNWLSLKFKDNIKSSIFVVEKVWFGEGDNTIFGYDFNTGKNISLDMGDFYGINIEDIINQLIKIDSLQTNNTKTNDQFSLNQKLWNSVGDLKTLQLPRKIKLINNNDKFFYVEHPKQNPFVELPKKIRSKKETDHTVEGFIDSYTLTVNDEQHYLYYDENNWGEGDHSSIRVMKNDEKYSIFSFSGRSENWRSIWEYIKTGKESIMNTSDVKQNDEDVEKLANDMIEELVDLGILPKSDIENTSIKKSNDTSNSYSIDGIYDYLSRSIELSITIKGNIWIEKVRLCEFCDLEYNSGIVNGDTLFDNSGYVKVGFISENTVITTIGGKKVILNKIN